MKIKLALLFLLSCGSLPVVQAQVYTIPPEGGDIVGSDETIVVGDQETLADVAREFNLGHEEIRNANPGVEFWLLSPGTRVFLPTRHILPHAKRQGIVLNVPEMRLYYFPKPCSTGTECTVITYPVSIGRMDWQTPLGTTRVTGKVQNPSWRPPESIRKEAAEAGNPLPAVVPPGPNNPLGKFSIHLDLPGYRIHGTNRPYGVGMRATHGCVRLYPEDIEDLFHAVQIGTPVQILNQPVKFGWDGDTLYVEVSPPLEEDSAGNASLRDLAFDQMVEIAIERPFLLLGAEFDQALEERSGIPVAISNYPAE
jgi:L,D-transpeptidase ErfK/SrfK